jgi:hypothetical protein
MMAVCFTSWRTRGRRLQEAICDGVQHSVRCNEHNNKHVRKCIRQLRDCYLNQMLYCTVFVVIIVL